MSSWVSFSELKNWDKCPFYHNLVNIQKIKIFKGNEYTAFGNAMHNTCEEILLKEQVNGKDIFIEKYQEELKKLASDKYEFNKQLAVDMKEQGLELVPHIKEALDKYFGEYEVICTEEKLFEDTEIDGYKFKGYVDLVLKTKDDVYHIIDWKTCSWGWAAHRKSDKMTTYQLTYYKYYFAKRYNLNLEDVETHFALLKRTAKSNKVELFKVASGKKKIQNALNFLRKALYNIINEKYIKNKLSCHGPYGACEFYKTKHCP